jgi:hypothetical protein
MSNITLSIYRKFVNSFLIICGGTDAAAPIFKKFQVFISYNVPAVYDVLTARIKKCVAFLGLAKCGWSEPWEGA